MSPYEIVSILITIFVNLTQVGADLNFAVTSLPINLQTHQTKQETSDYALARTKRTYCKEIATQKAVDLQQHI